MEEMKRSKQRQPCSPNNAVVYAGFPHKYVGYLLPALAKAATSSCSGTKDKRIKKVVRFEVKMALVLSAGGFKWSRALKHKLEHGNHKTEHFESPTLHHTMSKCNGIEQKMHLHLLLRPPAAVPRPLALVDVVRPKSINRRSYNNMIRGDDEFCRCMRALRRILPGGGEMCRSELLSEVKSYMVCLQLQVNILRTLVEIH